MDRRRFLASLAVGSVPAVAGCLGGIRAPDRTAPPAALDSEDFPESLCSTPSRDHAPPVSEIETAYPRFASHYVVTARPVADPDRRPVPFERLSPGGRFEVANAVGRGLYLSGRNTLRYTDPDPDVVSYRGSTFDVDVGVADVFGPDRGPCYDEDWTDPVGLDAGVEGGELTVTLTNALDARLAVHHYGRPYFGVLTAVGESATVIEHDAYEGNDRIRTDGVVTTERTPEAERETEALTPGGALQESYRLPDALPAESRIWLSVPIGDDSTELFGDRETTMTATVTLEP